MPVGKKPRIAKVVAAKTATRRPKTIVVTKTAPKMRDVYLPAKHLASKSRPQTRSNVITLPVHAKSNKTLVKAPIVKLHKLAA